MDLTMKQWVVATILVVIVVILIDGVRRMRKARQDSLQMSLKVAPKTENVVEECTDYGSEFPNGGARRSGNCIDKERIKRVKSQYDFGRDISDIMKAHRAKARAHAENTDLDLSEAEKDSHQYDEAQSVAFEEPQSVTPCEQTVFDLDDQHESVSAEEEQESELMIQSVGKRVEPTVGEPLHTHSANKPRYESKYFASNNQLNDSDGICDVLVLNVRAVDDRLFAGGDLLQQLLSVGLRYGSMDIFHRYASEDGEGPILFSVANILKPGTFDLANMESFSTVGVTFFLALPVYDDENMAAFEQMRLAAEHLASALEGELQDEQRSIMTAQTVEHYRERVRDFSRRQQLERNR